MRLNPGNMLVVAMHIVSALVQELAASWCLEMQGNVGVIPGELTGFRASYMFWYPDKHL